MAIELTPRPVPDNSSPQWTGLEAAKTKKIIRSSQKLTKDDILAEKL